MGVFEGLAEEIRGLDIPADGAALVQALALRDRLDALIVQAVGEFDDVGMWECDGSTSMTAWLKSAASMTSKSATHLVSMARRLRKLPVCSSACAGGSAVGRAVGGDRGQPLRCHGGCVRAGGGRTGPLSGALDPGRVLTGDGVVEGAGPGREEPAERERVLYLSATLDGRHVLEGHLDAEGGAVVAAALRLATVEDPGRSPAERRADALVAVSRFFLDHQQSRPGGRHRPHLNVVVDLEALQEDRGGRVVGGPNLDATTISRLVCDCALHRVLTKGRSAILDYGTSTRTIPAALWSALVIRDEHCRFPGCDRPSTWCEGHHIRWLTHGGTTELGNLVLLCSRHHHRLHEPDWGAKLLPDATFEVTDPDGIVRATSPPRSEPGWDGGGSSEGHQARVGNWLRRQVRERVRPRRRGCRCQVIPPGSLRPPIARAVRPGVTAPKDPPTLVCANEQG